MSFFEPFLRIFRSAPDPLSPRQGYDLWAPSYRYEANPVKLLSNETVSRMMPDLRGKVVLDVGCGTGYFCDLAARLGAARVAGIDLSPNMLRIARDLVGENTGFLLARAEQLPFDNESFDVVINALLAGHIQTLSLFVSEVSRVLRPGGICLISDFHPDHTLRGARRTFRSGNRTYEIRHYHHTLGEYEHCLRRNNLSIQEIAEPKWAGNPVVFALRAIRLSGSSL